MANEAWSAFERLAAAEIAESRAPGVIMGINKDGQSYYRTTFGYRDAEHKLDMTADTVLGVASVSKSLTSIAILQLQEAGKLSVDDPVLAYLPELRTPDQKKTEQMKIHHLLTHSAGLPPLPIDFLAVKHQSPHDLTSADHPIHRFLKKEDQKPILTHEELLDTLARMNYELLGSPGQYFSYSNDSYSLLGVIIARVSGKPYDVYIREHILTPANMLSSSFFPAELKHFPDVATIYDFREGSGEPEIFPDPHREDGPAVLANGFMNSTLRDMLNYAEIFRTGGVVGKERILSAESVRLMTEPHIRCDYNKFYGYGLMIQPDYFGAKLIEHGGSMKGVSAHLAILPERGITAVALANLKGTPLQRLTHSALNVAEERELEASSVVYRDYPIEAERLKEYVGRYLSGEGADFSAVVENGSLSIQDNTSPPAAKLTFNLQPVGEDSFLTKWRGREFSICFTRDEGTVKNLVFGLRQIPKING